MDASMTPMISESVTALDAVKLLKTPVASLNATEKAQAFAVLWPVDNFLNSKSRTAPGRLGQLADEIRDSLATVPREDALTVEETKAGEIRRFEVGGVEFARSVGGGTSEFDATLAVGVCEAAGKLAEASETTERVNMDKLDALRGAGEISDALWARMTDRTSRVTEERVHALTLLGHLPEGAEAACRKPTAQKFSLRHVVPSWVKGLLSSGK